MVALEEKESARPSRARKLTAAGEELASVSAARAAASAKAVEAAAAQQKAKAERPTKRSKTVTSSHSDSSCGDRNAGPADAPTCKGCTRKAKADCQHGRCIACCEKVGKPCRAHEKLLKLRQEEEAILSNPIPEAASKVVVKSRVAKGQFAEDSIEVLGDTVTIWSLRDFIRHKRMSKEVLEFNSRSKRAARAAEDASTSRKKEDRKTRLARKLESMFLAVQQAA